MHSSRHYLELWYLTRRLHPEDKHNKTSVYPFMRCRIDRENAVYRAALQSLQVFYSLHQQRSLEIILVEMLNKDVIL